MLIMSCTERVVVLVDMDCFFCQVEEKLNPDLEGKPIAVVQYNTWRGGGIIAVNYPAREKGVTRHMRGDDAKRLCPEITLARVPEVRGKADLTKYREAGKRVADVLQTFTPILERASVDEAYLDITDLVKKRIETDFGEIQHNNLQNTYVVGCDIQDFLYNIRNGDDSESNYRLAMGGVITEQIRTEVFKKTGYKCSAGIAHNKMLAKLVCGLHKPNKQTILPQESVPELYKDLPLNKVPGFGGKFGSNLSKQLNILKMGELIKHSESVLIKEFEEKTAKWLYNIARGIDYEPVTTRLLSKSIGSCKKFPGRSALTTPESIEHWVNGLTSDILERLEKDVKENNRKAKQISMHFTQTINDKDVSNSRTLSLYSYDQLKMVQMCLEVIKKCCIKSDGTYNIKYLGFSVGNFELNKKIGNISNFLKNMGSLKKTKYSNLEDSIEQDLLESHKLSTSTLVEAKGTTSEQQKQMFLKSEMPNENKMTATEERISDEDEIDNQICQDNDSIYSAETDELNEDSRSLIYYEDIYPESIASEPIFIKPNNNYLENKCATDNKISESSRYDSNLILTERPLSSSFFSKYFENYSTDDSCHSSPIKRNFDTSKVLMDEELDSSDECKSYQSLQIIPDKGNNDIKPEVEIEIEGKIERKEFLEICPECNKSIPKSELSSHMDYHYALNIVREEAHLYKPTQSSTSKELSTKNDTVNNSKHNTKKRAVDMKPIHTYLQTNKLNDENSELCSECNKRIQLDDIINHMDYHIAKKIHLEINATSPSIANKNTVDKVYIKAKRKKKDVKSSGNIVSFFKP